MAPAVDQVLAERERLARSSPAVASLIAAALLHAAVVALIVVLPRLAPPPPPLEYVAVQVVPAQRLGVEHPAPQAPPAPRPPAPAPQRAEEPPAAPRSPEAPVLPRQQQQPPAPKPPKPEKPKPAPPDNRVDPTTLPKVLPPPREVLQKKLGPAAAVPPEPRPGPPGASTGAATGRLAVGSSIAGLDNPDFTYDYYIAQLVSRIDQNWTRPPVGTSVRAVISFRIQSDGSINDLTVRESSGFDTFDLAALRAVQNASPFPPLPRAYTSVHSSLGVDLIVR
jgi:TonB family protein